MAGLPRRFHCDVASRVAGPHYEDAFAFYIRGIHVVLGVDRLAGEPSRIVRVALVPVMPVGNDDSGVVTNLARRQFDPPSREAPCIQGARSHDLGRELDLIAQAVRLGVRAEVRKDLRLAREVRVVLRHRELRVLRRVARGDDVRRVVDAVQPVPADIVVLLELVVRDARVPERLRDPEPSVARPHDAVPAPSARCAHLAALLFDGAPPHHDRRPIE